jgi:hypothetical protein
MAKKRGAENSVIQGSGNVFLDIGFPPAEAADLAAKWRSAAQISGHLRPCFPIA